MMTSSYLNERSRWLLVLLATTAIACSDSTPSGPDPCEDEAPPTLPGFADAVLRRASLRIEDRAQYAQDGTRTDSAIVSMALVDLSAYKIDSRFPSSCCGAMACFQLTGSPVEGCRGTPGGSCGSATCGNDEVCINDVCTACVQQPLTADKVVVEGLTGGTIELDDANGGKFLKAGLASPLFGADDIKVDVTGRTEAGYFASYTQTLTPPDALVLQDPDPNKQSAVPTIDMPIRWTKGNGEWIELTLRSAEPSVTDKVVCVARDDGCATVPIGALEWVKLSMKPGEKMQLIVQRMRSVVDSQDATTGMQIKASTRIDMLLDQ